MPDKLMPSILPGKKPPLVLYAIWRESDGSYSRGGCGPSWGSFPKTWGIGPFKSHLNIFCVDPYNFILKDRKDFDRWEINYKAEEDWFTKDNLVKINHPYRNCQVLEIRADDFHVINRFDAIEWIWQNAYKPYYEKYDNKRYIETIKEFAAKYGINY